MQQIGGALLLLERSKEGLEAMVLCEACVVLATPVEMELAGPQSYLPGRTDGVACGWGELGVSCLCG